jgi:hypothetical protein
MVFYPKLLVATIADLVQVQTPEQRKRNAKFAKENTAKMGKPESVIKKKDKAFKSPVSPLWLGMFSFSALMTFESCL